MIKERISIYQYPYAPQDFGIIKEDSFKAEVEFTGWSARYVSERIWSPGQKIVKKSNEKNKTYLQRFI